MPKKIVRLMLEESLIIDAQKKGLDLEAMLEAAIIKKTYRVL